MSKKRNATVQKRLHASVQKKNATFRACSGKLNPLHTCSGEIFKNAETGYGGAETGATKKNFWRVQRKEKIKP